MSRSQQAFEELRHSLWMLAVPLAFSCYSLFAVCQLNVSEMALQSALNESVQSELVEVDRQECDGMFRPDDVPESICGYALEWWIPVDSSSCEGGPPCYLSAEWAAREQGQPLLIVPGFLMLLLLGLVMRKISRSRSILKSGCSSLE